MKKVLLILTGGTICSFEEAQGVKDADTKKAAPIIIDHFRESRSPYAETEFDVCFPLDILSENMRIEDWLTILNSLKSVDFNAYAGIVMAHGTDTLAYTAAFLSAVLKGIPIPLILVSSQYPLGDLRANGHENFKNAVELIQKGIVPNVYTVYRNDDLVTYIHRGQYLKQCDNYSNDFYSHHMTEISEFASLPKSKGSLLLNNILMLKNEVLYIEPYVGIDYGAYCLEGKRAVLHGTYHSSTACTAEGPGNLKDFISRCKARDILFILSPFQSELLHEESMYATTKEILEAGAYVLPDCTKEYAYGKLTAGCSLYQTQEALLSFIKED